MSSSNEKQDRIQRERHYHNNRFSNETRHSQAKYYFAIKDGSKEYEARVSTLSQNSRVLEYGCGDKNHALELGPTAASYCGIDISDKAIDDAIDQASRSGLDNVSFFAMNAEELTFPDNSFDLVFGSGIIHHLDIEKSLLEVHRVLTPGGRAVFWEPLGHNHLMNLYRSLTPNARTPDEHPLLRQDFATAERVFGSTHLRFYGLSTLAAVPLRDTPLGNAAFKVTRGLDSLMFNFEPLRWQAWYCLIECIKSHD